MPKLAGIQTAIPVVRLMAVAVGWTAEGPVVGDAARRVRVTPCPDPKLSRCLLAPRSGAPTVQTVYTHHMEAPVIDPQVRWGNGRAQSSGALTADGGPGFPTQPLSPAGTQRR